MPIFAILAQATGSEPRWPAHGPIYIETQAGRLIVEPWNAASAALFLIVAGYWAWRLRGQYRRHAFLAACLPLVFIGGVGGTVYHAFRGHAAWLFMDWVPIALLCLAVSIYLWSRLLRRWWYALLLIPAAFGFQWLNWNVLGRSYAIAVSYSFMAGLIAVPAVGVLWKTGWRNGLYPLAAVVFFVLAVSARQIDQAAVKNGDLAWVANLPMGTHFLWHVFGAAAGHMIAVYLYRLPDALEEEEEERETDERAPAAG